MQKFSKWYPFFNPIYDSKKLTDESLKLRKFLEESEHGDSLEIDGEYQILGCVSGYVGPNGDGTTSEGDKVNDGDYIITSEVKSISRTRHKDADGLNFTIFTEFSSYDVSAVGFDSSVIDDAKAAAANK